MGEAKGNRLYEDGDEKVGDVRGVNDEKADGSMDVASEGEPSTWAKSGESCETASCKQ